MQAQATAMAHLAMVAAVQVQRLLATGQATLAAAVVVGAVVLLQVVLEQLL